MPHLSGARKAALFIAANVVMWPIVLAELANAFVYPSYPGPATTAGIAELVAMPLAWLVLAFWGPLRGGLARPGATNAVQALFALAALDQLGLAVLMPGLAKKRQSHAQIIRLQH